ncbi:MAG: OmpA family protein [Bacteroidia bacterium]|nr:OmpA family protein [Bacteroidia bacterium]
MRYLIIFVLFLSFPMFFFGQKKAFKVGDRVNISVDVYNEFDSKTTIYIPENKYTLVFNYNWGAKDRDGKDSIQKLEAAISKIIELYKIPKLRVICYSFDKGDSYQAWLQFFKSAKPFKSRPEVKLEPYNTNDYSEVAKTLKRIFNRVTLIGPEGKVMAESDAIGTFEKEAAMLPGKSSTTLKAKLLTDSSGSRIPLIKTIVCLVNELKADTFASTRTDEFGDFEMLIPENEKANYELTVNQNADRPVSVILAAQNGVEIATFAKGVGSFKYKLLKADVVKLQQIETKDITLAFNNFKKSTTSELKVIEYIVYSLGKSTIEEPAKIVLNKVVTIMKENPAVKLEVTSHTDSQGDDAANLALSEKRNQAVIAYIVGKGIKKTRIKGVGKGETMIRNRCHNNVECLDKEHEYNRRTEFNFSKE